MYQSSKSRLHPGMSRTTTTVSIVSALLVAFSLMGCATPGASGASPEVVAVEAATVVEPAALTSEEKFIAGVRAIKTLPMPVQTQDAEILDGAAAWCHLLEGNGYDMDALLAGSSGDQRVYTTQFLVLAERYICPE